MAKTFTNITAANATAGNAILASDHSAAFTTLNNHTVPPLLLLNQAAGQSIVDATNTTISFDTAVVNTEGASMWTSGSTVTIQTTGVYLVSIYNSWGSTFDVRGDVILNVNGAEVGRDIRYGTVERLGFTMGRDLTASDTLQVLVRQDNTANTARTAYINLTVAFMGKKA